MCPDSHGTLFSVFPCSRPCWCPWEDHRGEKHLLCITGEFFPKIDFFPEVSVFPASIPQSVNLRNKSCPWFYQQKWVYSGIAGNYNSGQASYSKTTGKSGEPRRGLFCSRKRELEGCYKQNIYWINWEFSVLWLSVGWVVAVSHSLGCWLTRRKLSCSSGVVSSS